MFVSNTTGEIKDTPFESIALPGFNHSTLRKVEASLRQIRIQVSGFTIEKSAV